MIDHEFRGWRIMEAASLPTMVHKQGVLRAELRDASLRQACALALHLIEEQYGWKIGHTVEVSTPDGQWDGVAMKWLMSDHQERAYYMRIYPMGEDEL